MIKGKHHGPPAQSVCSNVLRSSPSSPCSLVGRYYDPATGQFLSVDPMVAETGQAYAYTGDDPVNAVDSAGTLASNQFGQGCGAVVQDCLESTAKEDSDCSTYKAPGDVYKRQLSGVEVTGGSWTSVGDAMGSGRSPPRGKDFMPKLS